MSPLNNLADQVKALMNPQPRGPAEQLPLMAPSSPATRSHDITDEEWEEFRQGNPRNKPKSKARVYSSTAFDYYDPYEPYTLSKSNAHTTPRGGGHAPATYSSKKVRVVNANGSTQDYTLPFDCVGWFNIATQSYPCTTEHAHEILSVPADRCDFSYGEPAFNACVYSATQDYVSARWGRRLDDSDRRWLARHPLATDSGVPQEYTLTAIQQLVAPYGMKISRVRLRAGALVLGDQIMQWAMALGCNPMALADRRTSNAAAAALMGMDESAANALWRLEFSDTPLAGSIVGERGWSNGTGVSVGSMGGHARYLAPRAGAGDWFVSIQLEPEANVEYLVPPPDPEYVERKGTATLLVSKIVTMTGDLIAVRSGNSWRAWTDFRASTPETSTPAATRPEPLPVQPPVTPSPTIVTFDCMLCGEHVIDRDRCYDNSDIDVCIDCAEIAWRDIDCPECGHTPRWYETPYPMTSSDNDFFFACVQCKSEFSVPFESPEEFMQPLIEFACAAFATIPLTFVNREETPNTPPS